MTLVIYEDTHTDILQEMGLKYIYKGRFTLDLISFGTV